MEGGIIALVRETGSMVEDGALQKYVATFHEEIGTMEVAPEPKRKSRISKRNPKHSNPRGPRSHHIEDLDVPRESKKICCIPACTFEHGSKSSKEKRALFKLPLTNPELLSLWLTAIPRRNGAWVNGNARVCSGHFDAASINSEPVKKIGKNGVVVQKSRKRIELKPEAVPTFFPKVRFPVATMASHQMKQKQDRDIRRLQQKMRLAQVLDEILTFADLRRMVEQRASSFDHSWIFKRHNPDQTRETIHFLKLDSTGLAICAAISIPNTLIPTLVVQGEVLPDETTKNILLQEKVTSWPDVIMLVKWLEQHSTDLDESAASNTSSCSN